MSAFGVHPYDLDPSLVAGRTYASRRRRRLIDLPALLCISVVLLFLLPSRLVVPQLTIVGRPALLVGLLVGALWAISKLHPRLAMRGPQPLRWAAAAYLATYLMAYAAGYLRGLSQIEANSSDRAMIMTVIFLGIIMACADGIPNRARLDDVVRVIVWCASIMAVIGHLQVILNIDVTTYLTLPGLVLHADLEGFEARGAGFYRVASTTGHYIEFATVMALVLPFAIHLARYGKTPLVRQAAVVSALLIAAAIPMSLSRTGILALAVGTLVMLSIWRWRTRFNVLGVGIWLLAVIALVRPGLIGTLRAMFVNLAGDPSIQGRTEDYEVVYEYIAERPWLGRGPGTFIPAEYPILDNQWLQQIVSGGVFGLVALIGLHLTAIVLAGLALRRAQTDEDKHLAVCLIAVQLIAVVVHGTFDSFAFNTFTMLLAFCTGLSAAMWRLTHPKRQVRNAANIGLQLHEPAVMNGDGSPRTDR